MDVTMNKNRRNNLLISNTIVKYREIHNGKATWLKVTDKNMFTLLPTAYMYSS